MVSSTLYVTQQYCSHENVVQSYLKAVKVVWILKTKYGKTLHEGVLPLSDAWGHLFLSLLLQASFTMVLCAPFLFVYGENGLPREYM